MKNSQLEDILSKIDDKEKFRLLYRIEFIERYKSLSSVFARTNLKTETYRQRMALIYHAFFDGNSSSTTSYNEMLGKMLDDKKKVIDFFDAKTMCAFVTFINYLVEEFYKTKDFVIAKYNALSFVREFFDFDDLKLLKNGVCVDVTKLTKEQRSSTVFKLMKHFNIKDLYSNLDEYKEFKFIQENSNAYEELLTEDELNSLYDKPKGGYYDGVWHNDSGEEISLENGYGSEDDEWATNQENE